MTVRRLFSVGDSASGLARQWNAYEPRLVNADVDYEPSVGPSARRPHTGPTEPLSKNGVRRPLELDSTC